jgi:amidohydrolase
MFQTASRREELLRLVKGLHREQVRWRRHLHQYPELSTEELKTTVFLTERLRTLGLKILPLKMKTGVLAEIAGKGRGRTVAIRSDIDALPITEQTGLAYKSKHPGVMHACGHDVHMAVVLGAASIIAGLRDRFRGRVRFIFQPAEEQPPGGARPMIANGAMKDVDIILGLHSEPNLSTGKISLPDGPVMASVYDFDLIIHGKSGHAARPHTGVDAISTAAEVIESLQKVVSREISPVSPVVISFGSIQGGTARNVIADRVTVKGTSRAISPEAARRIPTLIKRTVAGICRARNARFEMIEVAGYPVLRNDPAVNRLLKRNYDLLFGKGKVGETEIMLGGEDFACYLDEAPGAMFRLGIRNKKLRSDRPWHSSDFMVDDDAMVYGTALLVAAAMDHLNG